MDATAAELAGAAGSDAAATTPVSSFASSSSSSSSSPSLRSFFTGLSEALERESEEVETVSRLVRDVHRHNRQTAAALQAIHAGGGGGASAEEEGEDGGQLLAIAQSAVPHLAAVAATFRSICSVVSASGSPAYRYHRLYSSALQQSVLLCCLQAWLTQRRLLDKEETAAALGLQEAALAYELDDYLLGCSLLSKELLRLAINSVRVGRVRLLFPISAFLHELYAAFRLLNLRNDELRRRVDALKSAHTGRHALLLPARAQLRLLCPVRAACCSGTMCCALRR